MSFGPRTRVRTRVRLRHDDDDYCDCTPLWREIVVACLPVALTAWLEVRIADRKAKKKRKAKRRADREAEEAAAETQPAPASPAITPEALATVFLEMDEDERAPARPRKKKPGGDGSVH